MNKLVGFMESGWGRGLRVLMGLALIYIGLAALGGTTGIVVAVIGFLPLAMGLWSPCLLGTVVNRLHHA